MMLSQIVSILQIAVMIVCPICCASGVCPSKQCCASTPDSPGSNDLDGLVGVCDNDFCGNQSREMEVVSACCNACKTDDASETDDASVNGENLPSLGDLDQLAAMPTCANENKTNCTKISTLSPSSKSPCPNESCPNEPCSKHCCQCVCGGALYEKAAGENVEFGFSLRRDFDADQLCASSLFAKQLVQRRSREAAHLHETQSGNIGRAARIRFLSFLI